MKSISTNQTNTQHFVKDEYFTTAELAKMFNVTKRTVVNWRNEGLINFYQVKNAIIFRNEDVVAFLEKSYVKGRASWIG